MPISCLNYVIMGKIYIILCIILQEIVNGSAGDVLGCGGFVKSHIPIDFSKILVKLYTKNGIAKDETNCAPNNGYYFIPLYDKGDYILKLQPPPGWSFTPTEISISVDGVTDFCSKGTDINFIFNGFGIAGKVESMGTSEGGPEGVTVQLKSQSEVRTTVTSNGGSFSFTPVYPGKYAVVISHPKWEIAKGSVEVQVAEGNTYLPPKSLTIKGYDVTGFIKSDGEPVENVLFVLSTQESNAEAHGCDKSHLEKFKSSSTKVICHVVSDSSGKFEFPSVTPGRYIVTPYLKGQNFHFHPPLIEFSVDHNSVRLESTFDVIGFSISGRILNMENGKPIEKATVFLNKHQLAFTKNDGTFVLEKIKAGQHLLHVEAENFLFDEKALKIYPSMEKLPDIYPSKYQVCGHVIDDKSHVVRLSQIGGGEKYFVKTDSMGQFCQFVAPGKYKLQVVLSSHDQEGGIQFAAVADVIDVQNQPVKGIIFSQLKATISGEVKCLQQKDCDSLVVILSAITKDGPAQGTEVFVAVKNNKYEIKDVRPGMYKVSFSTSKLCWEKDSHLISVSNETTEVPPFIQSGYLVIFISSHDTTVKYKNDNKTVTLNIKKNRFPHCVESAKTYLFTLEGCHVYQSNSITYDTNAENNEIYITAEKHTVTASIESSEAVDDVTVFVNIGETRTQQGPLKHNGNAYTIELFLSPTENAVVRPISDILYFKPSVLTINGENDCVDLGKVFTAVKGQVFQGTVIPPLQGVLITLECEKEALTAETDKDGKYKFPPLDISKNYRISAVKDGFSFVGPNEEGNFLAHKLAEIIVQVLDKETDLPLQGALLSLSGGESYRSNLQTNEDGKITFNCLSPSEYFLRPMMKEYGFEPSSQIINVKEGATLTLLLKGKRVAYSAFGQVRSLNGEYEEGMTIVATGTQNCSHFSEEASLESRGQFRIRGLQPYCSYDVRVNFKGVDQNKIERIAPSSIQLPNVNGDVFDVNFIVFRSIPSTDIMLKIYAEDIDQYKTFRVKVYRESTPAVLIHNIVLDTSHFKLSKDNNHGMLLQIPSIPSDEKTYSVQLESSLTHSNKPKHQIQYFTSNSSFQYFELEFLLKVVTAEQQVQQTPIWAIALILGLVFVIYNTEVIYNMLAEQLNKVNFNLMLPKLKQKATTLNYPAHPNDVDEIVLSINSVKRKPKSKKI